MRLTDHVALNFNNNPSTAVVIFDIGIACGKHGTMDCSRIYKTETFGACNSYCCLCKLIVVYVLLDAATLTEVFPCFFLGCKANARVILAKTGHGPHSSKIVVLYVLFVLYRSMYCLCVNVYCHRVTTQLQLTNISYHIIRKFSCFPMYDLIFFTILRDPNFETLLEPNQSRKRTSQTIQQCIHVAS